MEQYTFGSLVERAKRKLRDNEYSDADLLDFLQDAQNEVLGADKYSFLERRYTTNALTGGELDTPIDLQSIIEVVIDRDGGSPRKLEYKDPESFLARKGTADNYGTYTKFGHHILWGVAPIEREMDATKKQSHYNITIYYLARPFPELTALDEPVIPHEYSEILVLMALARAERARDNFDYAQIYENKADDLTVNMRLRYGLRNNGMGNKAKLPLNIRQRG